MTSISRARARRSSYQPESDIFQNKWGSDQQRANGKTRGFWGKTKWRERKLNRKKETHLFDTNSNGELVENKPTDLLFQKSHFYFPFISLILSAAEVSPTTGGGISPLRQSTPPAWTFTPSSTGPWTRHTLVLLATLQATTRYPSRSCLCMISELRVFTI